MLSSSRIEAIEETYSSVPRLIYSTVAVLKHRLANVRTVVIWESAPSQRLADALDYNGTFLPLSDALKDFT